MLLNDGKSNTHKSLTFDLYEQKERERGKRRKKKERKRMKSVTPTGSMHLLKYETG